MAKVPFLELKKYNLRPKHLSPNEVHQLAVALEEQGYDKGDLVADCSDSVSLTLKDYQQAGMFDEKTLKAYQIQGMNFLNSMRGRNSKLGRVISIVYCRTPGSGAWEAVATRTRIARAFGIPADIVTPPRCDLFYGVTKGMQTASQDPNCPTKLTRRDQEILQLGWIHTYERMENEGCLNGVKAVICDDQQNIGLALLIKALRPDVKVVYRAHLDISAGSEETTRQFICSILEGKLSEEEHQLLGSYILTKDPTIINPYHRGDWAIDHAFFHTMEMAEKQGLKGIPSSALTPPIDPLSEKNRPLSQAFIQATAAKYGLLTDEGKTASLILQISRLDPQKCPLEFCIAALQAVKQLEQQDPEKAQHVRIAFAGTVKKDNGHASLLFDAADQLLKTIPHKDWPSVWQASSAHSLTDLIKLTRLSETPLSDDQRQALYVDFEGRFQKQGLSKKLAERKAAQELAKVEQSSAHLNALEVNALQTIAAQSGVVAQMSNYEGYGLTGPEARVKGAFFVLSKVGGLANQAFDAQGNRIARGVNYPKEEIEASKQMYREILTGKGNCGQLQELYQAIKRRSSVGQFATAIAVGLKGGPEVDQMREFARQAAIQKDCSFNNWVIIMEAIQPILEQEVDSGPRLCLQPPPPLCASGSYDDKRNSQGLAVVS